VTEIERVRAVFFSVHQPELARAGFDNAPLVRLVELDRQLAEGTPLPSAGLIEFPNPITLRNQIRVRRVVVQGAISNFASLEGQLAEIAAWIERYLAD
jgi:hypothetical protein